MKKKLKPSNCAHICRDHVLYKGYAKAQACLHRPSQSQASCFWPLIKYFRYPKLPHACEDAATMRLVDSKVELALMCLQASVECPGGPQLPSTIVRSCCNHVPPRCNIHSHDFLVVACVDIQVSPDRTLSSRHTSRYRGHKILHRCCGLSCNVKLSWQMSRFMLTWSDAVIATNARKHNELNQTFLPWHICRFTVQKSGVVIVIDVR